MALWTILNYVELTGGNPIQEWLQSLPDDARAKIDYRLQRMAASPKWPEKWVSAYKGYSGLFEIRVSGNKLEYRPLFAYYGRMGFILLSGAVEKGGTIPRSVLDASQDRLTRAKKDFRHVCPHQFDDESDLEENGAQ